MSAAASRQQIIAIHALKSRVGLDDDTYRDFLARETGKRTSKALSLGEAVHVIDVLKGLSPPRYAAAHAGLRRVDLDGPYAAKLRALWISAWHLGITHDRHDAALLAFVHRQTGIEHTRWLREPADAAKAIEALKAWVAREGGVRWGDHPANPKLCVVEAQARRLGEPFDQNINLDAQMAAFGPELRARGRAEA